MDNWNGKDTPRKTSQTAMKYHAQTDQFTVSAADLRRAAQAMRCAIRHIREGHGLDLKGRARVGASTSPEFAEAGILNAAAALGIDLGSDHPGVIDVSNAG